MGLRHGFFLLAAAGLLTTCQEEIPVPVYLRLEQPVLVLPTGDTLRDPRIVPELSVIQGPDFLGTFQAGKVIPTVNTTDTVFFVQGAAWVNGQTNNHVTYPYWKTDTIYVSELPLRDTITLAPVLTYRQEGVEIEFGMNDDFESGNFAIDPYPASKGGRNQVRITPANTNAYSGSRALRVDFTAQDTVMELWSDNRANIPSTGEVWAEVAYRGDIKPGITLQHETADGQGGSISLVDPNLIIPLAPADPNNWQLALFNLSPFVDRVTTFELPRNLFLFAQTDGTPRTLWLDDIRIVYFP